MKKLDKIIVKVRQKAKTIVTGLTVGSVIGMNTVGVSANAISGKIDSATSVLQPIGISLCGLSLMVGFICLMIGKKLREEAKERIVWCVVGGVGIGITAAIVGMITGI